MNVSKSISNNNDFTLDWEIHKDNIIIQNELGKGEFGTVYLADWNKTPVVVKILGRKIIFPPPWICLDSKHNFDKKINKNITWEKYIDINKIKNLCNGNQFKFKDNGDLITNLPIKYYPNGTSIKKINNDIDIIAIVNFNQNNKYIYSEINLNDNYFFCRNTTFYYEKYLLNSNKFFISNLLTKYANNIIIKLNLKKYTFIHIRRSDFLDNSNTAPPFGSISYTNPIFIQKVIIEKVKNKNIFIATDEVDENYKKSLINLLSDYNLIFENDIYKYIPKNILDDNYCIFQILYQIAIQSSQNISTTIDISLGDKYEYSFQEHYYIENPNLKTTIFQEYIKECTAKKSFYNICTFFSFLLYIYNL